MAKKSTKYASHSKSDAISRPSGSAFKRFLPRSTTSADNVSMKVKFKRIFLPLHKTFKRFVLVVGFGILLFVLYTYILNNYVSKYRLQSLRLYYHWQERQSSELGLSIYNSSNVNDTDDIFIENDSKAMSMYGFQKVIIEPTWPTSTSSRRKLFILILISSNAQGEDHREKRQTIRKTWGNCESEEMKSDLNDLTEHDDSNEHHGCRIIFTMGITYLNISDEHVKSEAEKYGDIIVGNISDWNITHKLLLGIKWAANQRPKYLLKTDDDVYVHIPRLVSYLCTHPNLPKNFYGGKVHYGHVVRNPSHKQFVLKEEFEDDWYPPYCKGFMYVLSGHLLPKIVKMSTKIRRFKIDEAYIGIVLKNLGVSPIRIKQFVQFDFFTLFIEMLHHCDFAWIIGMGDHLHPTQMYYIHEQMSFSNYLPTWMCMHVDPVTVYGILVFTVAIMVFICMKSRYCPWWSPCG